MDYEGCKCVLRIAVGTVWFVVFLFTYLSPAAAESAASNEAHVKMLNGQNVVFDLKTPEDSRIIEAAWIQEAAANHKTIDVYGGVIKDSLRLENVTFDTEVLFRQCVFKQFVDFGHSIFNGGFVAGQTEFRGGASFDNVAFNNRAIFDGTVFKNGGGWFQDIRSTGTFSARQVTFGGRERTATNFVRAHFDLDTAFDFSTFDTTADFSASEFKQKADFFGTQFHHETTFERTRFAGPTSFGNEDPRFRSAFSKLADFNLAQFDSDVWFVGVQFHGDADFISSLFGRDAFFQNVYFEGDARFDRSFVKGTILFRSPTIAGATFARSAHFDYARFDSDAFFNGVSFLGPASFQEAAARVVHFSEGQTLSSGDDSTVFQSTVDLRGFTYDRLYGSWEILFGKLKVYDRQPYTQLSKFLRSVGEDDQAEQVYLARRKAERQQVKWKQSFFSWLRDFLWWFVANYGLVSWQLFLIPSSFVALGTVLFRQPGAVRLSEPHSAQHGYRRRITWLDSLRLSFRAFLPFGLFVDSYWIPTRWRCRCRFCGWLRFSDYANGLRILGWIFVPLWVAVLAGVFRFVPS